MKKSVLRRVKVGVFCAHVRLAVESLPEFLGDEKEEITILLDILEGQSNAVRKNGYLEQLTKEYIPKFRNIICILLLQLREAEDGDANANTLRSFLNAHFKGRRTTEYIINWAEGILTLDTPDHIYSAIVFDELKEYTEKMLEIRELYAKEIARIASIGRTIDTRMKIIDLLFQALEVAKGFRHRKSTRDAAMEAIDVLEAMEAMMRRNMPRGKRKKMEGEEGKGGMVMKEANEAEEGSANVVEGGGENMVERGVDTPACRFAPYGVSERVTASQWDEGCEGGV